MIATHLKRLLVTPATMLALALLLSFGLAGRAQAQQDIYDDALQSGWQNYSWATVNTSDTTTVHAGANAIRVNAGAYEALYLHHAAFDSAPYENLTFWINGGDSQAGGGQSLRVQALVNGNAQGEYLLPSLTAGTWQKITISLAALGVANNANFDGVWIQNTTGNTLPAFFVDDIAISVTPLPANIRLDVNPQSVIRTLDARTYGVNTAIWDSQLGTAQSRSLLAEMGNTTLRFPGGSISDAYDWQTNRSVPDGGFQWASSAATFAALAEARGAQTYITANYGSGTPEQAAAWVAYYNGSPSNNFALGVDAKGRDWRTVSYWAAMRAATPLASDDGFNFLRVSHPAPYNFRYWEVGNENYGSWEYDEHGTPGSGLSGAPHDAATYATWFKQFYAKMLAVDPNIRIGAVYDSNFLPKLHAQGATPHFLIYHRYPQNGGAESDSFLLQSSSGVISDVANIRQAISNLYGATGATIEIAITELNSVSFNPGKQTTSLVNGLFLADSLGFFARTEANACVWWDFRNSGDDGNNNSANLYGWRPFGDYGVVATDNRSDTPLNTRYPTFYANKLLTHWARGGDAIVAASSNAPVLSVHAAKLANGELALLIVNKDPSRDLTAQIALQNFSPGSGSATAFQYGKPQDLANGDLSTTPVTGVSSLFSQTFPSYSMTVLRLAAPAPVPTATPTPKPTATPTPTPKPTPKPTATPTPTPTPGSGGFAVIVDNTSSGAGNSVTLTGAWTTSTNSPAGTYYGLNFLHDGSTGKGQKSARYTTTLPTSGRYLVSVFYPAAGNRASQVPVSVTTATGLQALTLNQQRNGGQWFTLGTYDCLAGASSVTFSNAGTTGYVVADAVRWSRAP